MKIENLNNTLQRFSVIHSLPSFFRNDPFGSDLLPHDVPPLFDGLPEGDKENIMDV